MLMSRDRKAKSQTTGRAMSLLQRSYGCSCSLLEAPRCVAFTVCGHILWSTATQPGGSSECQVFQLCSPTTSKSSGSAAKVLCCALLASGDVVFAQHGSRQLYCIPAPGELDIDSDTLPLLGFAELPGAPLMMRAMTHRIALHLACKARRLR